MSDGWFPIHMMDGVGGGLLQQAQADMVKQMAAIYQQPVFMPSSLQAGSLQGTIIPIKEEYTLLPSRWRTIGKGLAIAGRWLGKLTGFFCSSGNHWFLGLSYRVQRDARYAYQSPQKWCRACWVKYTLSK